METTDRMTFDGSCDPNPGGRMGWSYIITFVDGRTVQQHGEEARNSANTVNIAEYSGLRDGLRAYLAAGGRGPLRVTGDSQLIIFQVNGIYKVKKPELKPYHAEITALLPQIRDVSITWNRREHNTAADQLARGEQPRAIDGAPDGTELYLNDALQARLPPGVAAAIKQLNQNSEPSITTRSPRSASVTRP
jgi:ribonuclease HI